nr:hypothetical protein [Tanacetum cinerariifolium]
MTVPVEEAIAALSTFSLEVTSMAETMLGVDFRNESLANAIVILTSNKGNIEAFNVGAVSFLPEAVLDRQIGSDGEEQLLIQWENRPLEESTWEDKSVLQQQFPFFADIEDNVVFEEGGDDTTQSATAQAQAQPQIEGRPKRIKQKPSRLLD